MVKKLVRIIQNEQGQSMVEYGLLVALIAVACIVTIGLLGTKINDTFTNIMGQLK